MSIFFVLGAPRSGTSLLAGTLHKSGICMGEDFTAPDEGNPRGYYEDLVFTNFNITMLRRTNCEHLSPFKADSLMLPSNHTDTLRGLIVQRNETYTSWGIKDPRIILLWHAYRLTCSDCWGQVRVIVIHRNLAHNAVSIAKRVGWGNIPPGLNARMIPLALNIVAWYERRMAQIAREIDPAQVLHVAFEDWWRRFDDQIAELEAFCGCEMNTEHFDPSLWRSGMVDKK